MLAYAEMAQTTVNAVMGVLMKAYLNVAEIANVTKKEKTSVQRWIKAGKFRNVRKAGNEYRVPLDEFKKWWNKNMKGAEFPERQK